MSWNNVFGELEFIVLLSTLWLLFKFDFEFSQKTFEPESIADKAVRKDIIGILCLTFCTRVYCIWY